MRRCFRRENKWQQKVETCRIEITGRVFFWILPALTRTALLINYIPAGQQISCERQKTGQNDCTSLTGKETLQLDVSSKWFCYVWFREFTGIQVDTSWTQCTASLPSQLRLLTYFFLSFKLFILIVRRNFPLNTFSLFGRRKLFVNDAALGKSQMCLLSEMRFFLLLLLSSSSTLSDVPERNCLIFKRVTQLRRNYGK